MATKKQIANLVGESWGEALFHEFHLHYMKILMQNLKVEREQYTVYPPREKVFNAFLQTPLDKIKVVIVGQDPYPTFGPKSGLPAAHGLCFSVPEQYGYMDGVPASLRNIFKELEDDIGMKDPVPNPDLTRWAKQGVFLLNTHLTVRAGQPASHSRIGWDTFTEAALRKVAERFKPTIFIGWGSHARGVLSNIVDPNNSLHTYIQTSHPSPMGGACFKGFFGHKPFSQVNDILDGLGLDQIDWFANIK